MMDPLFPTPPPRGRTLLALGLLVSTLAASPACRLIAAYGAPPSHDASAPDRGVDLALSDTSTREARSEGDLSDLSPADTSPVDTEIAFPHYAWMDPDASVKVIKFKPELKRTNGNPCIPFWNFYFGKGDLILSLSAKCTDKKETSPIVVFWSKRQNKKENFDNFREVKGINTTTHYEEAFTFSNSTLDAYITRKHESKGRYHIWHASRKPGNISLSYDNERITINNFDDQSINDIILSADGTRLYFAYYTAISSGEKRQRIYQMPLIPPTSFGTPQLVAGLEPTPSHEDYIDADPSLTGDERTLVFTSTRGTQTTLWYAVRRHPTDAFEPPKQLPLPHLDRYRAVGEAGLSRDGQELFFCATLKATKAYGCYHLSTP